MWAPGLEGAMADFSLMPQDLLFPGHKGLPPSGATGSRGSYGPSKAMGSGPAVAEQNKNDAYLPPCTCWAVNRQREGEKIPFLGDSRGDPGVTLTHPKTSRRTKTTEVPPRALEERKYRGNVSPTPKTGQTPARRSSSFGSQGGQKVTRVLIGVRGGEAETTGFSHCGAACWEIQPSE